MTTDTKKNSSYKISPQKYSNLFYRKQKVAYTHNGIFHADDVCSAALLKIVFPDITIVRVSSVPNDAELAFDIGGGRYDHHQEDVEYREDGNKYASFGLLWRDIGPRLFGMDNVKLFDDVFVKAIDYTDNTGYPNPFSSAIKSFNPAWNDTVTPDKKFLEAVDFAMIAIKNQFDRFVSAKKADDIMAEVICNPSNYPTPHSIILDYYMPYQKFVMKTPIRFVCYPSNRDVGNWNINTVPTEVGGNTPKIPFPEIWLKYPPDGATFVHPARFLASFKSKEDAIAALENLESRLSETPVNF